MENNAGPKRVTLSFNNMLKDALYKVVTGQDLTEGEMVAAMEAIMEGQATEAQIGAFITALRMKGETVVEITAAAKVMRAKGTRIPMGDNLVDLDRDEINVEWETIVDTCGTGGDATQTFNVSTTTAFVAAGAGLRVAKHGNRAVSTRPSTTWTAPCPSPRALNSRSTATTPSPRSRSTWASASACTPAAPSGFSPKSANSIPGTMIRKIPIC